MTPSELSPQERAVLALWLLMQRPMTTREIADRVGLSMDGARQMLGRISRVFPALYYESHFWKIDLEN